MILIADSGSTKTDWCLVEDGKRIKSILTKGMNPYFQTEEEIGEEIVSSLLPHIENYSIEMVDFYGAGCTPEKKDVVKKAIETNLNIPTISVNSDLLAAARGVCGRNAGIVCIMGTGSNSCFFDGNNIVSNVSPLGFILGDEGSGAVLGKYLVGDVLKNQLPEFLKEKFLKQFDLTAGDIIDRVYRKPFPNRFLASLSPFLIQNIEVPEVCNLVKRCFFDFFKRNVTQYDYKNYDVHMVGSVAFYYKEILEEVAKEFDIRIGNIMQQPMEGLVAYHSRIK
jgi:Predicted N-acetylglucosamine kinase